MADPSTTACPLVLSRTTSPQTSNTCLFHVDGEPDFVFSAHAVEGGTIVVQQVCCDGSCGKCVPPPTRGLYVLYADGEKIEDVARYSLISADACDGCCVGGDQAVSHSSVSSSSSSAMLRVRALLRGAASAMYRCLAHSFASTITAP